MWDDTQQNTGGRERWAVQISEGGFGFSAGGADSANAWTGNVQACGAQGTPQKPQGLGPQDRVMVRAGGGIELSVGHVKNFAFSLATSQWW